MKKLCFFIIMLVFGGQLSAQMTDFGSNYVHVNLPSNCFSNYTILDSTSIGSTDSDILIFNHIWGVDGNHTVNMLRSCGLWYTGLEWAIFDETQFPMDTNFAFNVLNAKENGAGFTHTVTNENLIENYSLIDHPLLNGHPERIFFITKTWGGAVYDTAHVGIWYNSVEGKWTIYNEAAFPNILELNSTYNIFVPDDETSCLKIVSPDSYYIVTIDDPRLNGNENAMIFTIHDYTTDPLTQGYVDDELGVWYDGTYWTVFTQNSSNLFTGATFNVLITEKTNTGANDKISVSEKIKVFPNPASNVIQVMMNRTFIEPVNLKLASTEGRIVREVSWSGELGRHPSINVSDLVPGLYLLFITTPEGVISTKVNIIH